MANLTGAKKNNDGIYFEKSPSSNIQYGLDFTDYLNSGDTVASATVTIETISGDAAPLAFPTNANTDVLVTGGVLVNIRLSGGTVNNLYDVKCVIVTTQGDTDARSFRILCTERFL
jgi:hypothetical protein